MMNISTDQMYQINYQKIFVQNCQYIITRLQCLQRNNRIIRMLYFICIITLLFMTVCFQFEQKYLILNTSSTKYVISTSIETNLDREFALYCPVLINTKDSIAQFTPSEQKRKLIIEPRFIEENQLLYNDFHDGEYWYGLKKSVDPNKKDVSATFALTKVIVDEKETNFFLPLFSLPLTFLSLYNLYKCDDVLISYRKTDNMIDVTVFSQKQGWSLQPEATWGFRNKDENINFCRQTYPLGTTIQVNVAENKYCILNDQLKENKYNLQEKEIYTLNDLMIKYSTSLDIVDRQLDNANIVNEQSKQQGQL